MAKVDFEQFHAHTAIGKATRSDMPIFFEAFTMFYLIEMRWAKMLALPLSAQKSPQTTEM